LFARLFVAFGGALSLSLLLRLRRCILVRPAVAISLSSSSWLAYPVLLFFLNLSGLARFTAVLYRGAFCQP
jgi:hypothetical protein